MSRKMSEMPKQETTLYPTQTQDQLLETIKSDECLEGRSEQYCDSWVLNGEQIVATLTNKI